MSKAKSGTEVMQEFERDISPLPAEERDLLIFGVMLLARSMRTVAENCPNSISGDRLGQLMALLAEKNAEFAHRANEYSEDKRP